MIISDEPLMLRAKFFRGLADPSRLALLLALTEGEKNVSELVDETALTQSNVSNHLACLKDCGLVTSCREWRNVYYRLTDARIRELLHYADDILAANADRLLRCTNYSIEGGS